MILPLFMRRTPVGPGASRDRTPRLRRRFPRRRAAQLARRRRPARNGREGRRPLRRPPRRRSSPRAARRASPGRRRRRRPRRRAPARPAPAMSSAGAGAARQRQAGEQVAAGSAVERRPRPARARATDRGRRRSRSRRPAVRDQQVRVARPSGPCSAGSSRRGRSRRAPATGRGRRRSPGARRGRRRRRGSSRAPLQHRVELVGAGHPGEALGQQHRPRRGTGAPKARAMPRARYSVRMPNGRAGAGELHHPAPAVLGLDQRRRGARLRQHLEDARDARVRRRPGQAWWLPLCGAQIFLLVK